jgi:PAS domain S-box-containing protein
VKVFADLDRHRRQLRRSDELVRNAFAAAPSGMALCDLDGLAMQVNPALERLTGRATALLERAPIHDVLHERDRPALVERLEAAATLGDGGEPWSAHVVGADGTPCPVTISVVAVRDVHGSSQQLLVQMADERDRRIAATLQRALLPEQLPSVVGVSLAAHIAPGAGGTRVGGDWYDAIALPGGRLGIVVGDVAGHGVDAAARMGEGHGTVALVERMNGYHAGLGADLMTTMVFAILEIDSGTLRFVNAGHPPPLIVEADGATRILEGAGPPLGVMDTWRFEERVATLAPEMTAILYTDGLVERRGERLDTGLGRLRDAVAAGGSPEEMVAAALEATDAEAADDDVTLVVVRGEARLGRVARLRLSPDPDALVSLRRLTARWLREAGAEADETHDLVMAANEAWQNALEHGTQFARATVSVDLEVDGHHEVTITVRDPGPPSRLSRPASDPDRGRGVELMRALADEVTLELAPHGSTVRLRRALRVGQDSVAGGEGGGVLHSSFEGVE